MKRYIIPAVVVLMILVVAWPTLGQREGTERKQSREGQRRFQGLSEEERAKLKERFQNMSEEEREKFRAQIAQMRERFAGIGPMFGREDQLKAIEAIEKQLVKLKAMVQESPDRESFMKLREASPEEQAKLRETWQKARLEQQKLVQGIQEQLARMAGPRPPTARPGVAIKELKEIHKLAEQENANKTVGRLEKLIAGQQRVPQDRPERPTRREGDKGRQARPKKGAQDAVSGKKAPAFKLNSFDDKTVSLSDYRGKVVVLEWFNFECPYVKYHYDTVSTMVDLAKRYKNKNVIWLAVNSTNHTTPEANIAFAKKHKLPYSILDDRPGRVGHAYGAKTTPHMFVIDTSGNIVYEGAIDNSPRGKTQGPQLVNYVDKALEELAAGKEISNPETKPYGCSVKYPK